MKRRAIIAGTLLALLGGAWWMWRWATTPAPPVIDVRGLNPLLVEAIEKAASQIRAEPRSGAAWGQLGMVLAANGYDSPNMFHCFRQAERFEPSNPAWPYLQGLQLEKTQPRQALPLLNKALSLCRAPEEQAASHFRLALILLEDGQFPEADSHVDQLRHLDPQGPRLHWALALKAVAHNDPTAAQDHLSRLLDSPFVKKRAYRLLATIVDKETGARYADTAVRLPIDRAWPDSFEQEVSRHYADRTQHYSATLKQFQLEGRPVQEVVRYLRNLAAKKADEEVYFLLGWELVKINEWEEAASWLRAALQIEPKNSQAHYLLGSALMLQAEQMFQDPAKHKAALDLFRQAVAAADQALALRGEYAQALNVRGWSLKFLDRLEEAQSSLRRAVLIQPESAEIHYHLGEVLGLTGQISDAVHHLSFAVKFDAKENPTYLRALKKWQAQVKSSK